MGRMAGVWLCAVCVCVVCDVSVFFRGNEVVDNFPVRFHTDNRRAQARCVKS